MGKTFGYARVSAVDEDPDRQLAALGAAGCAEIFRDDATGPVEPRPALEQALAVLKAGDTLVVWSLDRPARSMRHALDLAATLKERGVHLRVLASGIDTSASGDAYAVFSALSSLERDVIRERTAAKLAAARAMGRTGGRPSLLTDDQVAKARELYARGEMTVAEIGQSLGVSRATVYRALEYEGGSAVPPRRPARGADVG
ncbi:recombinase family protein [Arthrobacter caoxuetaonis]|uniref:Recombinase family protein n=1 Tax=Arthrobacter caoxuetaonis TaxID=2886935 RepID=A0A9X1MJR1_9MICC|nr:recombinase family protein [Arthrobacter caoxuetaonis]MCC3299809.1 recombinase family protein [Arthrobacter caoxuetaonis]USQ59291.1 recombinase family protein [Arthrobacter caoxuetaonis]